MTEPRARRSRNVPWGMIAVVVVVLVVAGYLVWSVIGKKSATTQYVTAQPTRGTLTISVAGNGSVASQNSASVNPPISGTVTQLSVSLGSKVKKGDVLFVVDNPDLDASVEQAKASYQNAQASTLKAEQSEEQADVSLKTGVQQAKQALQQAQSQVYSSEAAYYKLTVSSYPGYTPGASKEQVNAAKSSLAAAKTSLKTAQANYEHACTLQEQGHAAAAKSYAAALTSQSSAYTSYKNAKANADKRVVTAPIDGYITTLAVNNGDQLGSSSSSSSRSSSAANSSASSGSSSSSSSGSAPIVISDLSQLEAQIQIAETDRPKVKAGQKVELTFDAVPNLTITGKVTEIDAVGTSSSGVVSYGVTAAFDLQDKRLSPGMSASASIITDVIPDALLVPNAAIKTDTSGATYVQVLSAPGATPTNVDVQVGPAGDSDTQILSGLSGNENIVTQTIASGSSSSSTTRSGFGFSLGGGAARGGGGAGAAAGAFRGGN